MKRLFVAALFLSVASSAQAQLGSHDLTATYTGGTTEKCVYCHTPHNALTAVPLWNRGDPSTATFSPYSNPATMSVTPGQPTGVSKMCLSCHDGATNLDAYGGGAGTTTMSGEFPASPAIVGADLSDDHPVSILYNFPAEGGLNDPAGGGFDLPLYGAGSDQVECGSCHNPHDQNTYGKFLRKSNTASAICTTCHNK